MPACAAAWPQPDGRDAHATILLVEALGNIARVTLDDVCDGSPYDDDLTLLRGPDGWRIVNRTFLPPPGPRQDQ